MNATIEACAKLAMEHNVIYFAIQFMVNVMRLNQGQFRIMTSMDHKTTVGTELGLVGLIMSIR